jgi:hypothetical protein
LFKRDDITNRENSRCKTAFSDLELENKGGGGGDYDLGC